MDSKDASRRRRRRARSIFSTIRSLALAACLSYLRLREAEGGRQLRPLREGQVLRPLEPALQLLDLQRRCYLGRNHALDLSDLDFFNMNMEAFDDIMFNCAMIDVAEDLARRPNVTVRSSYEAMV